MLSRSFFVGFAAGSITVPLATKYVLRPLLVDYKYIEVDEIKHDMDFVGWNIRMLQENSGVRHEDLYIPTSYYQPRH